MGWTKLVTDEAELAGMPESALAAAKAQAEAKELEGYLLTLLTAPAPPIKAQTPVNGITAR